MLQGAYDPGKKKELERLVNDAIGVSGIDTLQYFVMSLCPIACKDCSRARRSEKGASGTH